MKHRKLFGIALLFPYLLWGICFLIANLFPSQNASDLWSVLLVPAMFYTIGVIFWFIPYTLLAILMWMWSKNKSVTSLRKLGLRAPIIFSILVIIEYSIILFSETGTTGWGEIAGFFALLIVCCLFFGYVSVGTALAVFKFLQSKNLVAEEVQPAN